MNHYCTYFDRNFLIQGLALAESLRRVDRESVLWILALDDFTFEFLNATADYRLRVVPLAQLEQSDPALAAARLNRTPIEYFFTLSPCWPRYLLTTQPAIPHLTYLDSDTYWFSSPEPFFRDVGDASIAVTEHRYPSYLHHHERYGRFNVGVLFFRNDETGRACLDLWRHRCLAWCEDRVFEGKYADQGYLDEWPEKFGDRVHITHTLALNLAPWNWKSVRHFRARPHPVIADEPLMLFHFARFRPIASDLLFQSGHLEYGVMPWAMRQAIYGEYWRALVRARALVRVKHPEFDFPASAPRRWHPFWRSLIPRIVFGSDWIRFGDCFISGRAGFGQCSGVILSALRCVLRGQRKSPEVRLRVPAVSSEPL